MERRKFTRECRLDVVKLIQTRGVTVAQAARFGRAWHGVAPMAAGACRQSAAGLSRPGTGQARAGGTCAAPLGSAQAEDGAQHLKKSTIGSSDQRNTTWGTVELEGDRDDTHAASGLVCGPEGKSVAAMDAGAVVERERPCARQPCRIASQRGVVKWRIHSGCPAAVASCTDVGGARKDIAGHRGTALNPADRRQAQSSAVDRQS